MSLIRFAHVIDGSNRNPLLYNSIKFSDRDRFEYTVISLPARGELQDQMKELGVRSFSLEYISRSQAPASVIRLARLFRKEGIQIVQTHLFDSSLIALTAARLARVPVKIFTGHHSHETPLYKRRSLTFIDGLNARTLSDHTIAPSQQMRDIFIEQFGVPDQKVEVVHHGFDLESWRADAQKENGIRQEFGLEGKLVFGAVGRLWWVKGFETLIKAFGSACRETPGASLVIVGGGETADLKEVIERENVKDRVFLAGRREDMASVMSEFDVLVHSSLAESFGMIFIEAMALGLPVVSTPVGVAPEIIRDRVNGFLATGTDQFSIEEALRKILSSVSLLKEMGEQARQTANAFDVRLTQKECDKLYITWFEQA